MKNTQPTSPTRVRLYSHVTKTRFLHVEDALSIGKVRLFAGTYSRGQGMSGHTSHYLDLADARIVFHALLNGEQDFTYKEYKGTPPPTPKQAAVSRVLSVVVKGGNVYMEFKSGPGQLAATGAITPNGRAETEVNVSFKLHEARRLASEVLAYIHAWDIYRIMTFRQVVGNPPAYLLTPATGESDEPVATPDTTNGTGKPTSVIQPPAAAPGVTRPVTRRGPAPKPNGLEATTVNLPANLAVKPADAATMAAAMAETIYGSEREMRYGDGLAVDGSNVAEIQAFQRYVAEKKGPPATKAVLQAYYRQQLVV